MLSTTRFLLRFGAGIAVVAVTAALATAIGSPPVARAADGRALLANAIATTRGGAYLVYNFAPAIRHRCSMPRAVGTR